MKKFETVSGSETSVRVTLELYGDEVLNHAHYIIKRIKYQHIIIFFPIIFGFGMSEE